MDTDEDKGNDKVHLRDSSSQEALRIYKRCRQLEPGSKPKKVDRPREQAPLSRGVRDIGWDHAVDLYGDKRWWRCKWCDLCRSDGVTTLKTHLTDSCQKIPIELSKKAPLSRGVIDIGWDHGVDLYGDKRWWQCKWCDLRRSGGVTTLKTHLTDSSCPKIPTELSKEVLNFIEEKKAARHLFYSNKQSPDFKGCKNDQQPCYEYANIRELCY